MSTASIKIDLISIFFSFHFSNGLSISSIICLNLGNSSSSDIWTQIVFNIFGKPSCFIFSRLFHIILIIFLTSSIRVESRLTTIISVEINATIIMYFHVFRSSAWNPSTSIISFIIFSLMLLLSLSLIIHNPFVKVSLESAILNISLFNPYKVL